MGRVADRKKERDVQAGGKEMNEGKKKGEDKIGGRKKKIKQERNRGRKEKRIDKNYVKSGRGGGTNEKEKLTKRDAETGWKKQENEKERKQMQREVRKTAGMKRLKLKEE